MRRLFCIWNRGYKTQHVIAESIDEALAISQKTGHTRRGHRRWKDETDSWSSGEECADDIHHGRLQAALNFGKSGVAKYDVDEGWLIDGQSTMPPEALPSTDE